MPAPGPGRHHLERDLRRGGIDAAEELGEAVGELRVVEEPVRDVDRDAEVVARLRPLLRRVERIGDDEERELTDERRALDVRDELRGRHEPAVRKHAADQRFGRARASRRELEDRLVDDEQLVLLERGLDVAHDARVHAAAEEDVLVARVALRRVHLAVRAREELFGGRAVVREDREADAAVDLDRRALDPERTSQRVLEPADERTRPLVATRAHREDDELVASDPRDGVRLAHDGLEAPRERLQDEIAGAVAADVVDVLEPVEVDGDQRERLTGTA